MLYHDNIEVSDISGDRMTISERLPQFGEEKVLIIVSGFQIADFYIAYKGTIQKVKTIRVHDPKYSDREGFFGRGGGRFSFGSGSVYEDKKDKVFIDFMHECKAALMDIFGKQKDIGSLYVFCPRGIDEPMRECIPSDKKKLVKKVLHGTYNKAHPFDLLKKIQAAEKEGFVQPISSAVQKFLQKTDRARKFFGGKNK